MQSRMKRILFTTMAVALPLLLLAECKSGMAFRVAYNNAPFLVMNRIDSYFDLTSDQERYLKPRLTRLHAWHKKNQMPSLLSFIEDAKTRSADGLSRGELDWAYGKTQSFTDQAVRRGVDDAAGFLATVDERQVGHLAGKMKEYNKELEEYVALPVAERRKQREAKLLKSMRDWVGDLRPDQERKVIALSRTMPETADTYLRYRRERQQQFLALLRSKPGKQKIRQQLVNWSINRNRYYPAYYKRQRDAWEKRFREVVLEVDATLTPEQRKRASSRIDSLLLGFVPEPVKI